MIVMPTQSTENIYELVFSELQSLQMMPRRLTDVSNWHEHIPFAFWLMKKLQPSVFVELGVHKGDSYSAFCQAIQAYSLPATCYGIDTWKDEEHDAGFYAESVYQEYSCYHDDHYSSFSRLVRTTFDDALRYFGDGSIDLLHINGRHRYEDMKHDFESWLPKLSNRAVVLFHDNNVKEREPSAWKYFLELSQQYPGRTFSFMHDHGLGVLMAGKDSPAILQRMCCLAEEDAAFVRLAFSTFGRFVRKQAVEAMSLSKIEGLEAMLKALQLQIEANERDWRKTEIETYKAEFQLACRLQEKERQLEKASGANMVLMNSKSLLITKPLRDLTDLVRRWKR